MSQLQQQWYSSHAGKIKAMGLASQSFRDYFCYTQGVPYSVIRVHIMKLDVLKAPLSMQQKLIKRIFFIHPGILFQT